VIEAGVVAGHKVTLFFDQLDSTVWEWTDELSAEVEARALKAWRERPNSRTESR
jgi:hypothetical protein